MVCEIQKCQRRAKPKQHNAIRIVMVDMAEWNGMSRVVVVDMDKGNG